MLPKNPADYRTVLWALAMPVVAWVQYRDPSLISKMWWVSCYFAVAASVIAHNHNHSPTFQSKRANSVFANWISVFYGYPTFAWIAHNLNHHRYVNKSGDATITWRHTDKTTRWWRRRTLREQLLPVVPDQRVHQSEEEQPRLYRQISGSTSLRDGAPLRAALACWMHGWKTGLRLGLHAGAPALFALWTVMFFNYGQHAHRSWSGTTLRSLSKP